MPERWRVWVLDGAGMAQRALDGTLDDGLVQVMAAALAGEAIHVVPGRRERPLPAELASGVRVFARQRVGHGDPAGAGLEVDAMLPAYRLDLRQQPGLCGGPAPGHAVPCPPAPAGDGVGGGA